MKSESKFKEDKEITVPSESGSAFWRNGSDAWAVFTQHFDPARLSQTVQDGSRTPSRISSLAEAGSALYSS